MILLVCGGRDFDNAEFAWRCIDRAHAHMPVRMIISGGAKGADRLGELWAERNNIHCAVVNAIWRPNGKLDRAAGPKRNEAMLLLRPDSVLALPGGNGTAHMARISREAGIPVWEPKP